MKNFLHTSTFKAWKQLVAVACFGVFTSMSAHADDPVAGATLFSANCATSGCHQTGTPLTSNASKIFNARNARSWIQNNINGNNSGMGRLSGMTAQQVADVAAYLGNSPSSLAFASTNVGVTAAMQTVTVKAALLNGPALSGLTVSTSGDFARSGGTCGTTLGTGSTGCTVIVSFTPTAAGARTGALSIGHSGTITPITIALSGSGAGAPTTAPVAAITPTSLTLASTAIGNTSAAQSVTVSNTGTASLSLSAITLSNPADYIISGGTCAAPGSVAAGANCTVSVAFKPSTGAAGARSGTLSLTHNAAGSPGSVTLTGTATAALAPVASQTASLSYGSLNVGTAGSAQTVTLSNSGNAALTLGTLSISSGTEFSISGGTCAAGGSVAAGASCTVSVGFTPSAAGARSANLAVTHNAAGGQSTTSLSGTGVALTPVIGVSPTTLSFTQLVSTTSTAQSVNLSNIGTGPLTLSALTLSGTGSSDYTRGGTCTSITVLAAGASCTLTFTLTPASVGARNASLAITHNAAGSPSAITLNGTGTAAPTPAISLNATTLNFTSQVVATTSAGQPVTVSNSGSAALTFGALTLTGTASGDFTRGGSCTPTTVLVAGGTCTVTFTFTPGAVGVRSATLALSSDASNGAAAITLSGTGAAAAAPTVSLAPASLAFGNQSDSITSTARSITLQNTGSAALGITGITATSGYAVTHNCGASLAAAASCTLSVTFTPVGLGVVPGSVSVASNAAGSPQAVTLSGTGVAASPVLAWLPTKTTLAFGDLTVGAAASTQTVSLVNQGPGTVTLSGFTLAGVQAADYSVSGGTCAVSGSLAQGASCTLSLAFGPGAVGARSAALQVTSTGTNPPDVALTGNGTAPAQPGVTVSPTALGFSALTGSAAEAQTLTLQSTGNAVLNVTGLRIASGNFTLAPASTNGCGTPPFDLLPGQNCAMSIGWSSSANGTETGTVEIDTSASVVPAQVAIQATRADPVATPAAAPATTSNSGGGGCSIARGLTLADPTLWLLVLAAAGVLWYRRRVPESARGSPRQTDARP